MQPAPTRNTERSAFTPRAVVQLLIVVGVVPLLPILISGRAAWWQAWVYWGINVAGFVSSRVIAERRNPGLLRERAQSLEHEDTAKFDKIAAPLAAVGSLFIPLAVGIEARVLGTASLPLSAALPALLIAACGYGFGAWAMVENRFFSGTVRIQRERDHVVVDSGPYRIVRHPGYTGMILWSLATPVFLGTPWAFIPALAVVAVLAVRTALEDATLRAELPGYEDYTRRTRYRLVPGVW